MWIFREVFRHTAEKGGDTVFIRSCFQIQLANDKIFYSDGNEVVRLADFIVFIVFYSDCKVIL
ncbi:hypothetical protein AKJ65_03235 [candidate division MSBL1 archaeon SCGC-AAA259E19]|uniref:Uncharacterized protein n=1 Tax=candidate division MSBL1 archaeon SCGC-AAA259E19 TaxID=1698264 RepID=A0A133UL50_9EURY|nr:hypothetical protein AKJ65_03235 [candidate division MSBL1 archaeon SCGC-AAA259E19]